MRTVCRLTALVAVATLSGSVAAAERVAGSLLHVDTGGSVFLTSSKDLADHPDRPDLLPHAVTESMTIHEDLDCRTVLYDILYLLVDFDRNALYPGYFLHCQPYIDADRPMQVEVNFYIEARRSDFVPQLVDYLETHEGLQYRTMQLRFREALAVVSTLWFRAQKLEDGEVVSIDDSAYQSTFRSIAYFDAFIAKNARVAFATPAALYDLYELLFDSEEAAEFRDALGRANFVKGVVDRRLLLKDGSAVPLYSQSFLASLDLALDCREASSGVCRLED